MDTDQPAPEEPSSDQPSPLTMVEQSPSGQVRSYECIFCKRGFSNAQALGGHMNIHRKDKAKLKKPSTDHQTKSSQQQHHHQFGEISISPRDVMSPPYSSIPTMRPKQPESKPYDEGKLSNITWPNWLLKKEEIIVGGGASKIESQSQSHGGVEAKRFSLFSEIPRVIIPNDQIQEQSMSNYVDHHQDIHREKMISHGESDSDIDLELRLGPEPLDSSPTNKGIKRFF